MYTTPGQPPAFSTRINAHTSDLNKAKWTEEHEEMKENFAVLKGAEQGMCENIRDALGLTYYKQTHDEKLGYSQVTVEEYLNLLKRKWCRLNTAVKKKMKDHFFREWNEDEHVTAYDARLLKEHGELAENGIWIEPEDVVEHYVLQMYKKDKFDCRDMTTYEAKPDNQKTIELTMDYFEGLVSAQEEFEQNMDGPPKRRVVRVQSGSRRRQRKWGQRLGSTWKVWRAARKKRERTKRTCRRQTNGCYQCKAICRVSSRQRTSK